MSELKQKGCFTNYCCKTIVCTICRGEQ